MDHATRNYGDLNSQIKYPGFLPRILSPPGLVEKIVKTQLTQFAYKTWLTRNRLPEKGPLRRGAPRLGDFRFSELHARFVAIGELVEGKLLQLCRTACQDPAHCRDGDDQVPEPEPSASPPVACATLSMPRNVRFTIPRRLI